MQIVNCVTVNKKSEQIGWISVKLLNGVLWPEQKGVNLLCEKGVV